MPVYQITQRGMATMVHLVTADSEEAALAWEWNDYLDHEFVMDDDSEDKVECVDTPDDELAWHQRMGEAGMF